MKMRPSKYVVIGGYNWSKEKSMRSFRLAFVLEQAGQAGTGNKMLWLAMENGVFLVGKSPSHLQLFYDYCVQNRHESVPPERFAEGSCEDGWVTFPDATPGWKRDEVKDFLAGQALSMALAKEDRHGGMHAALLEMPDETDEERERRLL